MLQKSDVTLIYDTVLSVPGMNETIKVNLQASRKNLLLLHKAIERGLHVRNTNEKEVSFLDIVPEEILRELSEIALQLLNKSGLMEMNEKLKAL